eukprot:5204652-Pyramimonas_sp.AAC.1
MLPDMLLHIAVRLLCRDNSFFWFAAPRRGTGSGINVRGAERSKLTSEANARARDKMTLIKTHTASTSDRPRHPGRWRRRRGDSEGLLQHHE